MSWYTFYFTIYMFIRVYLHHSSLVVMDRRKIKFTCLFSNKQPLPFKILSEFLMTKFTILFLLENPSSKKEYLNQGT